MPMVCSVCSHPQRKQIDAALLAGEAKRRIAARFGLSDTAVRRHTSNHLAARIQRTKMWDTETLAQKLQEMDADVQHVVKRGKQSGDDRLILSGVETRGRNIERIYKIGVASDLEQRLKAIEEQAQGQAQAQEQRINGSDPE